MQNLFLVCSFHLMYLVLTENVYRQNKNHQTNQRTYLLNVCTTICYHVPHAVKRSDCGVG
jgi:hypothetical protein